MLNNLCVCVCQRAPPQAGASELEIISHQVEEDNQCAAPVQLVNFAYRDLPLAALDISLAGSQLISNPDEDDNREGYVAQLHPNMTPAWALCCPSTVRSVFETRT